MALEVVVEEAEEALALVVEALALAVALAVEEVIDYSNNNQRSTYGRRLFNAVCHSI